MTHDWEVLSIVVRSRAKLTDLAVTHALNCKECQELLGHKSLRMTERYTHLSPAHKLDAVQRLARSAKERTGTATGTEPESEGEGRAGGRPER